MGLSIVKDRFEEQQARIETMIKQLGLNEGDPRPVQERLLDYAARGMEAPESLSLREITQICYALYVHYKLNE